MNFVVIKFRVQVFLSTQYENMPTTVYKTFVSLSIAGEAEFLSLRDGPLEKLWRGGGGAEEF